MIALTACYPAGTPLDRDYYFAKHLPLVDAQLKPVGLRRSEIRTVAATADGSPPPYQLIASLYFDDLAAVQAGLASENGQAVVADIANFFGGAPVIMLAEVAFAD